MLNCCIYERNGGLGARASLLGRMDMVDGVLVVRAWALSVDLEWIVVFGMSISVLAFSSGN